MNNIYMDYLTESEREDLILEKEIYLINTDIDYLFTTYEATDDNKTKGNIFQRLLERIQKLIKKFYEFIVYRKTKKPDNTNTTNIEPENKTKNEYIINNFNKKIKEIIDTENDIINECEYILDRTQMLNRNLFQYKDIKRIYDDIKKRSDRIQLDIQITNNMIESDSILKSRNITYIKDSLRYNSELNKHHNSIKTLTERYKDQLDDIDDCIDNIGHMYLSKTKEQRSESIDLVKDIKNIIVQVYGVYFPYIITTDMKLF